MHKLIHLCLTSPRTEKSLALIKFCLPHNLSQARVHTKFKRWLFQSTSTQYFCSRLVRCSRGRSRSLSVKCWLEYLQLSSNEFTWDWPSGSMRRSETKTWVAGNTSYLGCKCKRYSDVHKCFWWQSVWKQTNCLLSNLLSLNNSEIEVLAYNLHVGQLRCNWQQNVNNFHFQIIISNILFEPFINSFDGTPTPFSSDAVDCIYEHILGFSG